MRCRLERWRLHRFDSRDESSGPDCRGILLCLQHGSSGVKEIAQPNPLLDRCFRRHAKDYAELSATPEEFKAFTEAVGLMQKTQPNYSRGSWLAFRARRHCLRRARRIY